MNLYWLPPSGPRVHPRFRLGWYQIAVLDLGIVSAVTNVLYPFRVSALDFLRMLLVVKNRRISYFGIARNHLVDYVFLSLLWLVPPFVFVVQIGSVSQLLQECLTFRLSLLWRTYFFFATECDDSVENADTGSFG
jgi:hypothetical protein